MTFWFNGEWRNDPEAISIDDRGLLLGDGVFETILLRNGIPAFLNRHMARLSRGLQLLGIDARIPDSLQDIIMELAGRNGADKGAASLRLTVTRGRGPRGLAPPKGKAAQATIIMTCAPLATSPESPRKLIVSERVRPSKGVSAQCKIPSYVENILAMNDAIEAGADDALMLSAQGHIACASAANVFLISSEGVMATPALADGALAGVVRSVLFEVATAHGVEIVERSIKPEELHGGAVFLTNSLIGLAPATLSGSADAASNELFNRLNTWYQDALERDLQQAVKT